MNKQQFGDFIANNRKAAGLTQKALAQRLHVTDKAVSKWERALSYPDVTLLEPLAEALGMGVEELMACQRQAEKKEEEQPVKNLLEISRENQKVERRKAALRAALSALGMLGIALSVIWYMSSYASETREASIYMKETVGKDHFIYVENEGHMIQLKCGGGIDFDSLQLKDERGNDLVFNIDCRWNRNTRKGTVRSCELTQRISLGTYMDAEFEILEAPLFGHPVVYYRDESRYPDPYAAEDIGRVYLSNYRFWTGTWNTETFAWENEKRLLEVKDCLNLVVADADQDGENEIVVRTRWPEKPYMLYDWEDGEIVTRWLESVSPELQEKLLCIWEM